MHGWVGALYLLLWSGILRPNMSVWVQAAKRHIPLQTKTCNLGLLFSRRLQGHRHPCDWLVLQLRRAICGGFPSTLVGSGGSYDYYCGYHSLLYPSWTCRSDFVSGAWYPSNQDCFFALTAFERRHAWTAGSSSHDIVLLCKLKRKEWCFPAAAGGYAWGGFARFWLFVHLSCNTGNERLSFSVCLPA